MASKKKQITEIGGRMATAIWAIDDLANYCLTLSAQGKCCPNFAKSLAMQAKENHDAAAAVAVKQGYEIPTRSWPGGGK